MKKVNFNVCFKDIEGNVMEQAHVGKSLGNALAGATKGDALKMWSMAQRIYAGEEIELDPSDLLMIKDFINTTDGFTAMAKAQLLTMLQ